MPVRPELIDAVIQQESGGRADPPDAGAGAVGLMQIEPETAKAYGFDPAKLRDPEYNRKAGTGILNALLEKHKGDEREALKSYYGRGKPKPGFPTSDEYANRVLAMAGPDDPLSAALAGGTGSAAEDDPLSAALAQGGPAGSIFESTPQKVKRYARAAVPIAVGTALPVAAGAVAGAALGPEVSAPVKAATQVGAQAVIGAVTPYAQYGADKLIGNEAQMPTWKDAAQSAIINGAFATLGETGAALTQAAQTEDAVRAELAKLPQSERTMKNIREIRSGLKQGVRNREFYRAHGMTDEQVDQYNAATPTVKAALDKTIAAGDRYKGAVQTTIDETRKSFKQRYDALIPQDVRVDSVPIGQLFENAAQAGGEHEITPSFRGFLQRKGLELTKAGETAGPSVGGVPWKNLPEKLKEQIRQQGGAQGIKAPTTDLGIQDLRDLRTELRENISASATNLDRKVAKQLNDQISNAIDEHLTPEQRAGMGALDQEYGRFQDVLKKLDPRDEKYGAAVADTLFDPAAKNTGAALSFIDMAQKAEAVKPGVMQNLRDAFQEKMLRETRQPGKPFEELKALRKLQDQWGGDEGGRAVMGALFGKDSPMADPATFAKTLGVLDNPGMVIEKTTTDARNHGYNMLRSPYIQGMILFGVATGLSGVQGGGLYMAVTGQKGLAAQALAVTSLLAGPLVIRKVVSSGNSPLQRSMIRFMTSPNSANAVRYAADLTGSFTAANQAPALPSEEQIRAAE